MPVKLPLETRYVGLQNIGIIIENLSAFILNRYIYYTSRTIKNSLWNFEVFFIFHEDSKWNVGCFFKDSSAFCLQRF